MKVVLAALSANLKKMIIKMILLINAHKYHLLQVPQEQRIPHNLQESQVQLQDQLHQVKKDEKCL